MTNDDPRSANRRVSLRQRTMLTGVVVHGESALTISCTIRDLSDDGALVQLSTLTVLGRPTVLLAPSRNRAWEIAAAWQRGVTLGFAFLREVDLFDPASEVEKTAYRIWRARGGPVQAA